MTFDHSRMRPPGTRVQITGTTKNGLIGTVVEEASTEFKNGIAVSIGGVTFKFYAHQVIEILA